MTKNIRNLIELRQDKQISRGRPKIIKVKQGKSISQLREMEAQRMEIYLERKRLKRLPKREFINESDISIIFRDVSMKPAKRHHYYEIRD